MKSPLEIRQGRIGEPGRRSEKQVATRLRGSLVRGSGSGYLKGDLYTGTLHVEAKSTQRRSIGIQWDWLKKITKIAMEQGKTPVLTITFTNGDGQPKIGGAWVMIPEDVFHGLVQEQPK